MLSDPKIVLVVDDDPGIRDVISMILDMEGYVVHTVSNGAGVPANVAVHHPDLILLDVMLGDSDGRDICRTLKTDPLTRHLPVVIVSASHGRETLDEKQCGADEYIAKPFDMSELLACVRKYAA